MSTNVKIMKKTRKTQFQSLCQEVSDKTRISVSFIREKSGKTNVHEDDGTLHVTKGSIRACFDVGEGQRLSGKEQNARAKELLKALNMESYATKAAFTDEYEEEDNVCPHCGRY